MATEKLYPNSTINVSGVIEQWYRKGGAAESFRYEEIDEVSADDDTTYNALSYPPGPEDPENPNAFYYRVGLAAPSSTVDPSGAAVLQGRFKGVSLVSASALTVKLVNKTTPATVYATLNIGASITSSYADYTYTLSTGEKNVIEAAGAWNNLALEVYGAAFSGEFRHTQSYFEYTILSAASDDGMLRVQS